MTAPNETRARFLAQFKQIRSRQEQILSSKTVDFQGFTSKRREKYLFIILWDIIFFIASGNMSGRMVSVSDIYLSLDLSKSTAIRCVAILTVLGIVSKATDPRDRRRTLISISEEFEPELLSYVDTMLGDFKAIVN